MGTDIKALRSRIKSVDSTLTLTDAMGLVAASKLKGSELAMKKSREYLSAFSEVMGILSASAECRGSRYMIQLSGDISRSRIIVIAGDRGLAGGYNANVFRLASEYKGAKLIPIGKRACMKYGGEPNSSERYTVREAYTLAENLCRDFKAGEYDRLGIIFTEYETMMKQTAKLSWILPIEKSDAASSASVIFEPDEMSVLEAVMPEYVGGVMIAAVRESFASETAARRVAMDNAGKNGKAMIDELRLRYNHARQSAITGEIGEIVAGAGEIL